MIETAHRVALEAQGFTILRGAIPRTKLETLRAAFERLDTPSERWSVPRRFDARHAMLGGDADVLETCRSPGLLAAAEHVLGGTVRLKSVDGRDPRAGGGAQALHRDWLFGDDRPMRLAKALAFLDDFGPANGATRVVAGSHRESGECRPDDARAIFIEGRAGDIFVFHGRLVHGGSCNVSGAMRRALQIWYRSDV